jgi:SH2 domain-containing protein 4A
MNGRHLVLQPKKVAQRVALWEKRVMEERTSEIFKRLQKKKMEVEREAEEAEHKQEQLWREQGNPLPTHT